MRVGSQIFAASIVLISVCVSCAPEHKVSGEESTPLKSDVVESKIVANVQTNGVDEDRILTCTPGCALKNDETGSPIVPEWCLAWNPIAPTCVRNGEKVYCKGRWAGAGRIIDAPSALRTDFHLQSADEIARSPYKPFTEINFICTRIDAEALSRAIPTSPTGEGLPGEERAESCVPGCLVGRGLVGDLTAADKPAWCYRTENEYVYGLKDSNDPELSLCSKIKPFVE